LGERGLCKSQVASSILAFSTKFDNLGKEIKVALSRAQIKVLNYVDVEKAANKLEELIDQLLQEFVTEEQHVYRWNLRSTWDSLKVPYGEERTEIIQTLEPRYKRAGWDLTYDNKSGDLLVTER
jgi:hypothetical protein